MVCLVEARQNEPYGQMQRKILLDSTKLYENDSYASQNIAIPQEIELKVNFPGVLLIKVLYFSHQRQS